MITEVMETAEDTDSRFCRDGFNGMVKDLKAVDEVVKREPRAACLLFGHSMGSAAQNYISNMVIY